MSVWKDKNSYRFRIQRGHRLIKGSARSLGEAKALEAKALADLSAWRTGSVAHHTIEEAMLRWMTSPEFRDLKSTKQLENHLAQIIDLIEGRMLTEIVEVAERVKQTLRAKGNKPATVNRKLAILRRVANLAYERWRWLSEPLGKRIKLLAERNERQIYLTKAEVKALLAAVTNINARAALAFYAYTGWRAGEIHRLKPSAVQGKFLVLDANTKNDRPRKIPILPPLKWALRYLPLALSYDGVRPHFLKARKAIGRDDLHAHDLRHTIASWIVGSGGTLPDVQAWLGQKSPLSANRYAHLSADRLRVVAKKLA